MSYKSSGEKLIKYQANSSCVIMSVILMTTLFYKALILQGEIWCWSLLGLKGLKNQYIEVQMYTESGPAHEIIIYYNDYFSLSFVFAVQPLQPVYMIWLAKCLNLRRILKVKFNAHIIITQPLCEGLNVQLYR